MPFFGQSRGKALGNSRPRVLKTGEKMGQIARTAADAAKWVLVDDDGKLILGPSDETIGTVEITGDVTVGDVTISEIEAGTNIIGKMYITDGVEDVHVNASNQLEVSVENTVTVDATDLDIRNLTAANDTVMIGDGAETAHVTASNELNVLDSNSGDIKTAVELLDDVVATDGAADTAKLLQVGGTDGTNAQILSTTAAGHLNISDGGNSVTVDGTFWQVTQPVSATDLDIRNLAPATDSVKINDGSTDLAVAIEGSAGKTAGIQVMGRYDSTIPTAVDDGDATLLLTDTYGALQTTGHVANAFRAAQNQSSAQTNTELVATPGAGKSLYITDIIISNGATEGNVKLVEDTGGTPADILEVMYFAINGGCVINLQTPLKLTANKNLGYTSVTCTTHSVAVSGYIAP